MPHCATRYAGPAGLSTTFINCENDIVIENDFFCVGCPYKRPRSVQYDSWSGKDLFVQKFQ